LVLPTDKGKLAVMLERKATCPLKKLDRGVAKEELFSTLKIAFLSVGMIFRVFCLHTPLAAEGSYKPRLFVGAYPEGNRRRRDEEDTPPCTEESKETSQKAPEVYRCPQALRGLTCRVLTILPGAVFPHQQYRG